MLKRMRRRVILAAMIAFTLVIVLVGGLVNYVNYAVVTSRTDDTIDSILYFEMSQPFSQPQGEMPSPDDNAAPDEFMPPMEPFTGLPDVEANYMMRFFIVVADSSNNLTARSMDNVASVSEDEALVYAKTVLNGNSDRGYLDGYRYAKVPYNGETVMVFLNTTREVQSMNTLMSLTLGISAGSLVLVFILVVIFSRRAIKPIATNIEVQKRFITDAGHELKTPLTSIATSIDVIEMEHGSDEWTENVKNQVGRLSGLVSDMVTLSKLDEVKPVINKENFDLSSLSWETVEGYLSQAKACGKTIKINIEDEITYYGEKDSIRNMMSVLIDNAIRYSDENSEISFTVDKYHGKVRIEVFNTCNYKTRPDVDRLFDRFYRPDESRSSSTGGNGIGLAIAKAVVESHGGTITAKCPSGKTMAMLVIL